VSTETGMSASIEEYLEWIYRLSKEQDEVTTTDLARSVKVSPASVTGMLKRLQERGLILHEKYHGITLTEEGRAVALVTIRRHGLLERLLVDVLGLPWHAVDEIAGKMEHHITPEVEERLQHVLGFPKTCPHGQPINWVEPETNVRLGTLEPGDVAEVARIGDESPDFLEYVWDMGMKPGALVEVVRRAPFNGPLIVRVRDEEHPLGDEVCSKIWVVPPSRDGATGGQREAEPAAAG
jgi:DtxR family transcriptional regulator, Mn-dependent transcriptional regulator